MFGQCDICHLATHVPMRFCQPTWLTGCSAYFRATALLFISNSSSNIRYVILIVDEMKVQEDLVYDKTVCNLLVFVNVGEVNNELEVLEGKLRADVQDPCETIATHMLTLMVRELFIKTEFPYINGL